MPRRRKINHSRKRDTLFGRDAEGWEFTLSEIPNIVWTAILPKHFLSKTFQIIQNSYSMYQILNQEDIVYYTNILTRV